MKNNVLRTGKRSYRTRILSCFALIGGLVLGAQLYEPTSAEAGYGYPGYRSSRGYNNCYRGYRQPVYNSYRGRSAYGSRYSGYRSGYRSYSNYRYRSNNRNYYNRY